MRYPLLLLLGAGLVGFGCGDDTSTGGGGAGASGGSGGTSNGGNGGQPATGGSPSTGGGGSSGDGGTSTGGSGPGNCDAATGEVPTLAVTEVTSLPGQVVQIKSAPGDNDRLYLVEKTGLIHIFENGALVDPPFLDVTSVVKVSSEEGLLGLAFHPDYVNNGRFFIFYSAAGNGDLTVMEYKVSADPLVADTAPVQLVVQHATDQNNHNGGAVEFGNDGFLYISMGDGGAQCDPGCDAQNLNRLLGKISRIDVDGTADGNGYPAAPGNPDGGKYFHVGLRNPWRISFDQCTGDLYIGDVGQNKYEEIDIATQAAGALNFGWPVREGQHPQPTIICGYDNSCAPLSVTPTEPVAEYDHDNGCSVTGGYVYHGAMAGLRGWYFYGDYCTGAISILQASGGALTAGPTSAGIDVGGLSCFGQDGNGEVYAGSTDGTVYRIDPG